MYDLVDEFLSITQMVFSFSGCIIQRQIHVIQVQNQGM